MAQLSGEGADPAAALMRHEFGDVSLSDSDSPQVGVVEVHRGPNNHFDGALLRSMVQAIAAAEVRGHRAVVLCAEGKHFSAGMNFNRERRAGQGREVYEAGLPLFETAIPLIAAVQGAAVGGGFALALAADFRVADEQTKFQANFARLGLHHGFGMTVTLPRVVGEQRALELLVSARPVRGPEAARLGLVDRLAAEGETVREAAVLLAAEVAENAPLAVAAIRRTLRGSLRNEVEAIVPHEHDAQLRLAGTADFAEGVAAARERRAPVFENR